MSRTKINVAIGVLVGALCGFVFGAAFTSSEASFKSSGNNKGNISELTRFRHSDCCPQQDQSPQTNTSKDTVKYTLTDEQGANWNIIMIKK